MSLAEELKRPIDTRTRTCSIQVAKMKLNKADQQALTEALEDMTIPSSFIARALKKEGFNVAGGTISRHRRKECTCGTK